MSQFQKPDKGVGVNSWFDLFRKTSQKKTPFLFGIAQITLPPHAIWAFFYFCFCLLIVVESLSIWAMAKRKGVFYGRSSLGL